MNPKNLPLGINTLDKLRGSNCIYVDKTRLALQLIKQPGAFFLSRPRRFGKSLFIDTLKEIFEGNQKLFEGLYIYDQWDWSRKFPVIKIDFAGGVLKNRQELDLRILDILHENAEYLGVSYESTDIPGKLGTLIRKAMAKYGQRAVVLVDEYDKPILDNIDNPPIAAEMREGLKNLYSVLKQQDANIQFIFMTGVTKFSKVSLFSGLNQLTDITISRDFSTICGYTQEDLEQTFAQHLQGVDWDKLRLWYNGY
ncbi:MAG: AAA family ATPase, partial [Cylindrospermopsis raciborskii 1523720]|uniref:ATP-binding protein n=1 Tax=Cylindrospermopsis raciborskii TaxID=77022 RepID=UPI002B458DD5